jgi:transcriptional regulator with XRE-family HTH domain
MKGSTKLVGPTVRSLRVARGLTQQDLAEAVAVAPETVSRIERGRLNVSVDLLGRLAATLEVGVESLLKPVARTREQKLRPAEARLLHVVRGLNDTELQDLTRALKTLLELGSIVDRTPKRT